MAGEIGSGSTSGVNNQIPKPDEPPKADESLEVSKEIPGASGQQHKPEQTAVTQRSISPVAGPGSLKSGKRKRRPPPLSSLVPAAFEKKAVQSPPQSKSEELFSLIKPADGNAGSAQEVGMISLYQLSANGSSLYAHQMPTKADVSPYWHHVAKNETPMIVQLETNTVNYLKDAPAQDQLNPEVISEPVQAGDLTVSFGKGTEVEKGVSLYPTAFKGGNAEADGPKILRVSWEDHGDISTARLQNIVDLVPNGATVHCKQGKGRTGVVVIAHQMASAAKQGALKKDNVVGFVFDAIAVGRMQRKNDTLVENHGQFQSLVKYGQALTGAADQDISAQIEQQLKAR